MPQTIFNERSLVLSAVLLPWAIELELVRYAKQDPANCAAVLRLGVAQRGICWMLAGLEQWVTKRCWPMGYTGYPASAEAAALSARTGCPPSDVSAWIAWCARGADDERDPALFLVN